MKKIDITGKKFGRWTIKEQAGHNKSKKVLWLVKCDCGNEAMLLKRDIIRTKSCGCLKDERRAKENFDRREKRVGTKVGKLSVLRQDLERIAAEAKTTRRAYYIVCCDCDTSVEFSLSDSALFGENAQKSCKCAQKEAKFKGVLNAECWDIVMKYVYLVENIAVRFRDKDHFEYHDIIDAGMEELQRAAYHYIRRRGTSDEVPTGVSMVTYLYKRIESGMAKYPRASRCMEIPTLKGKLRNRLYRIRTAFYNITGHKISLHIIAELLDIEPYKIENLFTNQSQRLEDEFGDTDEGDSLELGGVIENHGELPPLRVMIWKEDLATEFLKQTQIAT